MEAKYSNFINSPIKLRSKSPEKKKPVTVKLRIIYKKNLVTIAGFLNAKEKLSLLVINSVFASVIKSDETFNLVQYIKSEMGKEQNAFPLQLLLRDDAVLIQVMLNKLKLGLSNGGDSLTFMKLIAAWLNSNFFMTTYFNEKFEVEVKLRHLYLTNLNFSDTSLFYLLFAIRKNNNLISLNLAYNKINLEVLDELELLEQISLSNIEDLDMSNNLISNYTLINKLILNTKVRRLDVSGNPIVINSEKFLNLGINSNLNILNMSKIFDTTGLHIKELDSLITFNPEVTELSLSNNMYNEEDAKIISHSLLLNNTTQITTINLSNNKMGSVGAEHLSSVLLTNNTLTSLNLNSNVISHIGLFHLTTNLVKNKSSQIKILYLADNYISTFENDVGNKCISELISKLSLEDIDLSSNSICQKGAFYMAEAMKNNKSIRRLIIKNNKIGEQGARYLAESLKFNNTLEEIDVSLNFISNEFSGVDLDIDNIRKDARSNLSIANSMIASIIKVARALKIINISRNNFTSEDCFNIVDSLISSPATPTHLNLEVNNLCDHGIYNLEDYFTGSKFKSLIWLNLNENNLGVEGCRILVNYLISTKTDSALKHLFVAKNAFLSEGMAHFAEYFAVKEQSNLIELDLSRNSIKTEGLRIILGSLYGDENLEILSLATNEIEDIESVGKFLIFNTTLDKLNLTGNPIPKEYINVILDELPANVTLTRLLIEFQI